MGSASSGCSGCRCQAGTSRPEIYRTPGVALTLGVDFLQQRVQIVILHLTPRSYESERSQRPRGVIPPLRFQTLQVLHSYQRGERSPPPLYDEALPPYPTRAISSERCAFASVTLTFSATFASAMSNKSS